MEEIVYEYKEEGLGLHEKGEMFQSYYDSGAEGGHGFAQEKTGMSVPLTQEQTYVSQDQNYSNLNSRQPESK
jgi:hypothetical protein